MKGNISLIYSAYVQVNQIFCEAVFWSAQWLIIKKSYLLYQFFFLKKILLACTCTSRPQFLLSPLIPVPPCTSFLSCQSALSIFPLKKKKSQPPRDIHQIWPNSSNETSHKPSFISRLDKATQYEEKGHKTRQISQRHPHFCESHTNTELHKCKLYAENLPQTNTGSCASLQPLWAPVSPV